MVVVMDVVMVEAMAMAMVIPAMAMVIPAMAMVAIPASMVLLSMLLRRLHPRNPQHRVLASNLVRNPDEPAQGCVGSFLFNSSPWILIINPQCHV